MSERKPCQCRVKWHRVGRIHRFRERTWEAVIDIATTVDVVARRGLANGSVVELTLAAPDGSALPAWSPGAHIDVILPSGLVRQYSLCGEGGKAAYTIAVLQEPESRGGSTEIHNNIAVGTRLMIRGPRNHFPLVDADHIVFLAGGIGITPILAMARARASAGASWELHYGGRTREGMAYVGEVEALSGGLGALYPQDEVGLLPLQTIMSAAPKGAVVYVCGPEPLLVAAEQAAASAGLELHLERFGPSSTTTIEHSNDTEFKVVLQRTARTMTVPVGQSLIDVVREVVPAVPFSCEEGYCGSCETPILDGVPDHRDSVLSSAERAANNTMMICVGRALTPQLTLDL